MPKLPVERPAVVMSVSEIRTLENGRWIRCFRAADGAIYFKGKTMTRDNGATILPQTQVDLERINGGPERAVFVKPGLFYALDGPARLLEPGRYQVRGWRSTDELQTLQEEEVIVEVPGGPARPANEGEWFGLYVYRTILERPDGSWLMTMYGNMAEDEVPPAEHNALTETSFMQRPIVVTSQDEGRTWRYLASVAIPRAGDPIGEGFVEPAITLLEDGRLLCVMRTGHHYPLYASWSADGGRTWTYPTYTGLDRGCDPCLIRLQDGRVALSWGRRFPEGWSQVAPEGDEVRFHFPGEGFTNLAISDDGGASWVSRKVAQGTGSCYSTIIEIEPNVIFCQVDEWYFQVSLKPR
jgi:hypothetical protein